MTCSNNACSKYTYLIGYLNTNGHAPSSSSYQVRAAARDRAPLPRNRRWLGTRHVRRLDGRVGGVGRAGEVPDRVQRLHRVRAGPDRLPCAEPHQHLQPDQRVPLRRWRGVALTAAQGGPNGISTDVHGQDAGDDRGRLPIRGGTGRRRVGWPDRNLDGSVRSD